MADTVVSKTYRVLRDASTKAWDRISFWTKGSSVEFNDGLNAEQKLGAISGITDSLNSNASNVAASAYAVNELNNQLGGLSFAQDENGNWGYKVGADPVVPFSNGTIVALSSKSLNASTTIDVGTYYKGDLSKLTKDNFLMHVNGVSKMSGKVEYTSTTAQSCSISYSYTYTESTNRGELKITVKNGVFVDSRSGVGLWNKDTSSWASSVIYGSHTVAPSFIPYLVTGKKA